MAHPRGKSHRLIDLKMQHRVAQARERCRRLSSSARVWGQRPGQLKEADVIGKEGNVQ